jgi:hypothetical protein
LRSGLQRIAKDVRTKEPELQSILKKGSTSKIDESGKTKEEQVHDELTVRNLLPKTCFQRQRFYTIQG